MTIRSTRLRRGVHLGVGIAGVSLLVACQSSGNGGNGPETDANASGGAATGGGGTNTGGASGATSTGGASGATNTGGTSGATNTGGTSGATNTGGTSGATNTGGATSTGGASGDAGGEACSGAKPDATNTGVPAGVTLTEVDNDVTVTKDGTMIDAEDIHGFLIVKASHVTVKRSIVRGGTATHNGDGIAVESGTDVLIEDTEVALAHPSAYLDGVSGSNFTVRRANIHGGVDGMKLGSNSTVECSYIHGMSYFASDPNQGGGPTHNDAIQILSGTEIHVDGNQLLATADDNSAIQVTQDFGKVTDLYIDGNWADGGGCSFNIAHKVEASLTGVTVTNNRFGRDTGFANCPILKSTKTTLVLSGNVWDDNGTPVNIQTHD